MAKKENKTIKNNKKEKEKKNIKEKKKLLDFIPNEISWIIKVFVMLFISLSIFSHNYLDSSFNRVSNEVIRNYFGIIGSYFSDVIFQLLGVVSYMIPIFFPIYYIKKQFFKEINIFYVFIFQIILTTIIISSIITIYPVYNYQGGILGSILTLSLTSILNNIGATLLLSFILLSIFILMFEIPAKRLSIAFLFSAIKLTVAFFSIIKNHLLELKTSSFKETQENDLELELELTASQKKKIKKEEAQNALKKEKIIGEYDNIKMEKLKIKEERRLEKEKIKLEKIKEKQEQKRKKKQEKELKKISKEEENIINDIFDDIKENNKEEAPAEKHGHASQQENKVDIEKEFFSNEKPSKDQPFVMYSNTEILDEIIEIKDEVQDDNSPTPPNIKFQNFENTFKEEINKSDDTKNDEALGDHIKNEKKIKTPEERHGHTSQQENEEETKVEIKVAKKTNINSFNNFNTKDKTEETSYKLPPIEYLKYDAPENHNIDESHLMKNARLIIECLADFNINDVKVKEIFQGPTLTTYELEIKRGIQISKVIKYTDEIAAMLKVSGVRMVSIPEKGVIGVEVPNKKREIVWLKEIIASEEYKKAAKKSKLTVVLGKDISGEPIIANLAKMPHLLIAGTTGSGKSVFNNVLITSILYNATPDEVKFILIDPKMLEFSLYNDIPNLLFPVIIDPKKAAHALNWAVDEMERRYKLISEHSERDIISYNNKAKKTIKEGPSQEIQAKINELELLKEEILQDNSISESEKEKEVNEVRYKIAGIRNKFAKPEVLPYIVVVLDEYADLMMVAGKNVEISISRIAQKARAAGIHLVIATQRPDKDVVTGIIKANLPVRVALSVKGSTNSKIILDSTGAEKLLGHGDLLYLGPGTSNINRIQSPLVTSDEQKKVLDFLKEQGKPTYSLDLLNQYDDEGEDGFTEVDDDDKDSKYDEAVKIAIEMKKISASYLQRRLKLGYNRAARIVEVMEKEGIVGPPNGSKPRKVMVDSYNIS